MVCLINNFFLLLFADTLYTNLDVIFSYLQFLMIYFFVEKQLPEAYKNVVFT